MSKYSKDLDEGLQREVKNLATQYGLIEIETLRLKNKKNSPYGEVLRSSDLLETVTEKDKFVVVALNEDLMLQFDEQTRTILIENLLERIMVEETNDGDIKISIKKDELTVGLGTFHKYGKTVMDKLELVILTQQQMREKEEMEKQLRKEDKKH